MIYLSIRFYVKKKIHFGESRSSKTVVLAILGVLKMINLVNLGLSKMQIFIEIII